MNAGPKLPQCLYFHEFASTLQLLIERKGVGIFLNKLCPTLDVNASANMRSFLRITKEEDIDLQILCNTP